MKVLIYAITGVLSLGLGIFLDRMLTEPKDKVTDITIDPSPKSEREKYYRAREQQKIKPIKNTSHLTVVK